MTSQPPKAPSSASARAERFVAPALLLGGLAVAASPLVLGNFSVGRLRDSLVLALLALSLDFVWGKAKLLVLGQAVFFAFGAYGLALLTTQFDVNVALALPLAIAASAVFAGVVGYFVLYAGIRAHFFAVITVALSLIAGQIVISLPQLTGGDVGILGIPPLSGSFFGQHLSTANPVVGLYVALTALFVVSGMVWFGTRGRYGRILEAIGTNERRAAHLGYDTSGYLVVAFVIGAAIAALAGALFATNAGVVAPDLFGVVFSIEIVIWVILGGRGSIAGPVLVAILLTQLQLQIGSIATIYWPLIVGAILVCGTLLFPEGIAGLLRRIPTRRAGK